MTAVAPSRIHDSAAVKPKGGRGKIPISKNVKHYRLSIVLRVDWGDYRSQWMAARLAAPSGKHIVVPFLQTHYKVP